MKNHNGKFLRLNAGRYLSDFSILVAVWSLCIAWPLYQVLIAGSTFFSTHNAGKKEILFVVLLLSFGFPLLWAFFSTISAIVSRLLRNILFAFGLFFPLTLFLANSFLYQPWDWLPVWGIWILGVLLVVFAFLLAVVLTRWHPSWQSRAIGILVAILVVGLFVFSPSMINFFFPKSSQVPVAGEMMQGDEEKKPNIVVLLFDELSLIEMLDTKDQINERLFPNFAKLSKESIWFPNAYAMNSQTHLAVPSILTGMIPSKDNLPPTRANHPLSIRNLLEQRGYNIYGNDVATKIFSSLLSSQTHHQKNSLYSDLSIIFCNVMLPPVMISVLNIPSISGGWADFSHDRNLKKNKDLSSDYDSRIDKFFEDINYDETFFAYYHFMLPHTPYKFLFNGASSNHYWEFGEWFLKNDEELLQNNKDFINILQMQYLQQACYADAVLGKVLEKMKQNKIYKNSVLIVLSDHGVLNESGKGRRVYSENNIPYEIASVPVFMKLPGEKTSIKHDLMRHIDVLPTLMDSLNWNIPWKTDGKSLLDPSKFPDEDDLLFFGIRMKGEYRMKKKDYLKGFEDRLEQKKKNFSSDYKNTAEIYFIDDYQLSGSKVSDYQQIASQKYVALIEDLHFYKNVNPNNYFFPVFPKGTLNTQSIISIVFALNGKIFYVGKSFQQDRGSEIYEFIGYFPPAAFINGYNKIELFVPVHEDGKIYLSPIEIKGRNIQLTDTGDLIYDDRQIKIDNINIFIRGHLAEIATMNNGVLTLSGWAIDKKRVSGADEILLFVKDEAVAFATPSKLRPDIVDAFNDPRYELSGFSIIAPNINRKDLSQTRLIIVSGNVAKELDLPTELFFKVLTIRDEVNVSTTGVLTWQGEKFMPCTSIDKIKGSIDIAGKDNNQLKITGWVIDFDNKKPADELLLFINGEPKVWSIPNMVRPDLVKNFNNQSYLRSGFDFNIELNSIGFVSDSEIHDVQVYGLCSGHYFLLKSFVE
jgi:hypothetical protein